MEIAFSYLNEQTKSNILAYLDGMTIEEASCWMDEVRGDNAYDCMRSYHYADFVPGERASNITGDNIIGVLNSTFKGLDNIKQLSHEQIKTNLLYLMHLIGDIHQPLHVGYPDDRVEMAIRYHSLVMGQICIRSGTQRLSNIKT